MGVGARETSRSSASRDSRSVSSAADRTARSSSSGVRSRRSARSSSARSIEERRSQLVARIGDEAALPLEGGLEASQHLVEHKPQLAQLVVGGRQRRGPPQLGHGDRLQHTPHRLDGPQGSRGQEVPPPDRRGGRSASGPDDQQLGAAGLARCRVLGVLERDAHHEYPAGTAAGVGPSMRTPSRCAVKDSLARGDVLRRAGNRVWGRRGDDEHDRTLRRSTNFTTSSSATRPTSPAPAGARPRAAATGELRASLRRAPLISERSSRT